MTTRPPTFSTEGMVTSSHPAASTIGVRVLADGGNAIDATLAMAAMTWLTLPGQCGIGGDAFAVVREPDGTVWTVGGSGFGPDGGETDFYLDRGLTSIPLDGALGVAVPGAPAALAALHARGATRSLSELWEPAARSAERGLPCSAKTRQDVREAQAAIALDPGLASVYFPDGALPHVGQRLRQVDLARTIRSLAADPSEFYLGSFAQQAVAMLRDGGAPFSGDEWAAGCSAVPEPALAGSYAGAVVYQTAMPTPGWMVLQQAALCDHALGFSPWMTAPAIDRLASAARVSFEDRFALCGSDNDEWRRLLQPDVVARSRAALDAKSGRREFSVAAGDTTSTVAIDSDGRAVSFIHSLAFTFGAKITVPGTGVVLNNRFGRGAYLLPGHPNSASPRRKPLHTLNAWVVADAAGELIHVGNTPGGDGQVQWNMQLLSHLLDHGLDPAEAVAAPRFMVYPGSDADVIGQPAELRCESRIGESTLSELRSLGHDVVTQGAWDGGGSAQIISLDHERGLFSGAADPRQEGIALGV
ncbi:gamma-glutamyltransferase [Rhodococcus sp. IEGM 1379]|uniref:gamma-glutamyltransferase family protein n=1 Tax=Rhodococcus sp. IEGM 1379 TaxID=3047086 RepID=UPI0024B82641|nr:gamma-glutamyltransferase [Rhodococcus sp. IEGM 1379]MDI9915955.1 gamma-glutamyltransferase [Rhodococcus sp. IEGM 1379]